LRIEPPSTEEEAAAIVAALETLSEEGQEDTASLKRSRWRLAGLLGHALESGKEPVVSLWAYSRWKG
jgi:predicted DNA-binding transcriptional regulator YafY